jgi:hypothetical protein
VDDDNMEAVLNRKQIAGAELLNLLVVDDEKAVRPRPVFPVERADARDSHCARESRM